MKPKFINSMENSWQLCLYFCCATIFFYSSNAVDLGNEVREVQERFLIPGFLDVKSIIDFFVPVLLGNPKPPLPECTMQTMDLVRYLGYPAEVHHVTTKDGYILELHRIPYGKSGDRSKLRVPALLQHMVFSASHDWITNFPDQSLGFMLADKGFDVWLGNARGNTYSNKHVSLNINQEKFWEFCQDDIAKYDLPATIDYILNVTAREQLYYIGHSMGTTTAFMLLSTNHAYDKKIKTLVALAPVAAIPNMKAKFFSHFLFPLADIIEKFLKSIGIYDFLSNSKLAKFIVWTLCAKPPLNEICVFVLEITTGQEGPQLNRTRLPVYFTDLPAGSSQKTALQYVQNYKTKKFSHFDYGPLENFIRYGQIQPPLYDLKKINVPTVLISAEFDTLSTPKDVSIIAKALPKLVKNYEIPKYSHVDVILATDAGYKVNEKIISLMDPNL